MVCILTESGHCTKVKPVCRHMEIEWRNGNLQPSQIEWHNGILQPSQVEWIDGI